MQDAAKLFRQCAVFDDEASCRELLSAFLPVFLACAGCTVAWLCWAAWWAPKPQQQPCWWESDDTQKPVCIVTGANRGIGAEVVRELAAALQGCAAGGVVVLCSRDELAGEVAAERIRSSMSDTCGGGARVEIIVRTLDIQSKRSVDDFAKWVSSTYKDGLSVLVNNAAVAHDAKCGWAQAELCVSVNYRGTVRVCEALGPLLRPGGRVVSVSSSVGTLTGTSACPLAAGKAGYSESIRSRFLDPGLSLTGLNTLASDFLAATEGGSGRGDETTEAKEGLSSDADRLGGWPASGYCVSKTAVTQLARVLSQTEGLGQTASLVVAVCPGLCRTDMVDPFRASSKLSFSARWTFYATQLLFGRSASEAAADIVHLAARLPSDQCARFHGRFVQGREVSPY